MEFSKIHGIGNDFIYFYCMDGSLENFSRLAIKICNRYYGIGGDGVIVVLPSAVGDYKMKIFNSDGSEAEMCGNGIRGVGKFLYDNKYTTKTNLQIETLAGIKDIFLDVENDKVSSVIVNMGEPKILYTDNDEDMFRPIKKIPLDLDGEKVEYTQVSMGNPHAVVFVNNLDNFDINKYGPMIENHKKFYPYKTNVEFVEVKDRENIKMRVWERGVGETLACGTGACAATIASIINNFTNDQVCVKLKGGELNVKWHDHKDVLLSGVVEHVFNGTFEHSYT